MNYFPIKPRHTWALTCFSGFVPDIYSVADLEFGAINGCFICFLSCHTIPFCNMDNGLHSYNFHSFFVHTCTNLLHLHTDIACTTSYTLFMLSMITLRHSQKSLVDVMSSCPKFSSQPSRRQKSRKWLKVVTRRLVKFSPSSWSSWGSRRTAHTPSALRSRPCQHRQRSWTPKWRWPARCPPQPR